MTSLLNVNPSTDRNMVFAEQPDYDPGKPTVLPSGGANAIGHMLGLLGDEWSLLIARNALAGTSRYAQFKAQLPISSWALTNRLGTLVQNGLLYRRRDPVRQTVVEYLPTPRSRQLWPVMVSMWAWESKWVAEHRDKLPRMRHETCQQQFEPLLRCACCQEIAGAADVSMQLGPSGAWERCAPVASTRRKSERDPGLYPEMMSAFGNRWAAAVLLASFLGATRFNEFYSQLGAPPGSLAGRLQTFCAIGVFSTSPVAKDSERAEYLLTDKGRALFPVLALSLNWAQRWFHAPEGDAITLMHNSCGEQFVAELVCNQCFQRLEGSHVHAEPPQRMVDLP